MGVLTISLVAFLAAAYLLVETRDPDLRASFTRRAMLSCVAVLIAAGIALWEARDGAPEIYFGLRRTLIGGIATFVTVAVLVAALAALWNGYARAARLCAIAGAVLILWGWALSQYPFLVEPHLTIAHAAPPATLRLLVLTLVAGSVVLFPLLVYLYRIFKSRVLPGG